MSDNLFPEANTVKIIVYAYTFLNRISDPK